MPKVSVSSLPVSGLFGIAKPSGPTSMAIINDMKKLVGKSKLFVYEDKLGNKGRRGRDPVKIGQGGTLDPLADGVLGSFYLKDNPSFPFMKIDSCWGWKGNQKTKSVP